MSAAVAEPPASKPAGSTTKNNPHSHSPAADLALVGSCFALACLSLLGPWALNPDAWYWLIWGDQIRHLTLDTAGSWTSWKPLASFISVPLSLFGDSAPAAWTVVSRTGALLTVAVGFRLSSGLVIGSADSLKALAKVNAAIAGATTAILLVYLQSFNAMIGYCEMLTLALGLLAIERGLAGRHVGAFVLGWLCCLGRPEPIAVMVIYGAWLWTREPRLRPWIIAAPVAVLAAWFVPDWIGSGDWRRSNKLLRDFDLRPGRRGGYGPGVPGLLRGTFFNVPSATWIATALGALGAARQAKRGNRAPATILGIAVTIGLALLVLAAAGGPARARYAVIVSAPLIVLAGFGVGWASQALGQAIASRQAGAPGLLRFAPAGIGLACLVAIVTVSVLPDLDKSIRDTRRVAALHTELDRVIAAAGGPAALRDCLPIARKSRSDGMIAWKLELGSDAFAVRGGPSDPRVLAPFPSGTTFRDIRLRNHIPNERSSDAIAPGARMVANGRHWEIWRSCPPGPASAR